MALPDLIPRTGDTETDTQILWDYLWQLIADFPNAVGQAIEPTEGEGGDSSLTVDSVPTGIVYLPGSSLSIDGVIFGHIDVTFTLPDRAIDCVLFYREQSVSNFKVSYSSVSPLRLINLKVGTIYELQLSGQSANGSIGPRSTLTNVTLPTTSLDVTAPTGLLATATYQSIVLTWVAPVGGVLLEYEIQRADDSGFTTNILNISIDATYFINDLGTLATTRHYRIRSVDTGGSFSNYTTGVSATTINVPDDSIITSKVLDDNITYAKIQETTAARLLGRGSASTGNPEELTLDAALVLTGTILENSPDTGWAISNVVTDKVYDADSTTLDEIADVLGTLIDVLTTKKILST